MATRTQPLFFVLQMAAPILLIVVPAVGTAIWWNGLVEWIDESEFLRANWGNVASLLGVALAWVGFVVTITIALRSRAAARRAAELAEEARNAVISFDSVVEVTKAIAILDELLRRHLAHDWQSMPDRFSVIRGHLVAARSTETVLNENVRARISGVAKQLDEVDANISRVLLARKDEGSPA